MKSFLSFIVLIFFAVPVFASPMQIKDSTGVSHYFSDPPKRIVSCMPSITEMLFALELDDEIVGVTTNCNYPQQALAKLKVGREIVNIEKVISLSPDLVLMLEDAQKTDIRRLREFSLPVFTINPHNISDVEENMLLLGKITGKNKEAREVVGQMRERLEKIQKQVKARTAALPVAMVVISLKPLILAGPHTFIADVLNKAGVENLANNAAAPYPLYSFEELVKKQPELIIIPTKLVKTPKDIYKDQKLGQLEAVKEKRVLFIEADIISRPGPRVVEAVEKISNFVYNSN
ncbi:MAG: helical backbone metal receptor [Candidatus Saganbacteria bacterium]|nr:helical backbone metal receptor [Candidatus Saganbacteria bacterium]